MPHYMLLFRQEQADFRALREQAYKELVGEFESWYLRLRHAGKFIAKGRLKDHEGRTLRHHNGRLAVDGPFSETKEALAGFFTVQAGNYDEAVALAQQCPLLPHGASVEVRELHDTGEFTCYL